jgi:hypothetical protein
VAKRTDSNGKSDISAIQGIKKDTISSFEFFDSVRKRYTISRRLMKKYTCFDTMGFGIYSEDGQFYGDSVGSLENNLQFAIIRYSDNMSDSKLLFIFDGETKRNTDWVLVDKGEDVDGSSTVPVQFKSFTIPNKRNIVITNSYVAGEDSGIPDTIPDETEVLQITDNGTLIGKKPGF